MIAYRNLAALGFAVLLPLSASALAQTNPAADDPVVAALGDEDIHLSELQPDIGFQIYLRRVDIYTLIEQAARQRAERRALEAEARRRGVSVDALVQSVTSDVDAASDEDIDRYLARNPEAAAQPNARERVAYYLTERARIQARLDFVNTLLEKAAYRFVLEPPKQPRISVPTQGAPARGPSDARITIVHFASFTSPRSARSAEQIRRITREFPNDVRWVHYSLPSDRDELGLAAAQLASLAQERGVFWELHDRLFALEGRLKPSDLADAARELGLSPVRVGVTERLEDVRRVAALAARIGIEREPVLFINGRYYSPTFPYERLRGIVGEELGVATEPAAGTHEPKSD